MKKTKTKAIVCLILGIIGTIFIAFLPVYNSVMIRGLGDYGSANWKTTITAIGKIAEPFQGTPIYDRITDVALLFLLALLFWGISIILDVIFLIMLLCKRRGYKLIKFLNASWIFSLLYILVFAFVGYRLNSVAAEQLGIETALIVPSVIGYVILVVMLLNRFVFYNLYEKYTYSYERNC